MTFTFKYLPGEPKDKSFAPYARELFNVRFKLQIQMKTSLSSAMDKRIYRKNGNGAVIVTYQSYMYDIEFSEAIGILDSNYAILLDTNYLHSPAYLGSFRDSNNDLPD